MKLLDFSRSVPLDPDSTFGLSEDMYHHLVSFIRSKDVHTSDAESRDSSSSSSDSSDDN